MTIDGTAIGLMMPTATFAGMILYGYIKIHVRLKALEIEIKQIQKNEEKNDQKFELILEKISLIHQNFNDLLVEFANIKK